MTLEQIRARLTKAANSPSDEWTVEDYQAPAEAYSRADQETKDVAMAIVRGEVDIAASVSLLANP